jgi:hypothetical protein
LPSVELKRSNPALAKMAGTHPKPPTASPDSLKVLLTYRQPEGKVDAAALLAEAGLLADVFERSILRLSITKGGGIDAAASALARNDPGLLTRNGPLGGCAR